MLVSLVLLARYHKYHFTDEEVLWLKCLLLSCCFYNGDLRLVVSKIDDLPLHILSNNYTNAVPRLVLQILGGELSLFLMYYVLFILYIRISLISFLLVFSLCLSW